MTTDVPSPKITAELGSQLQQDRDRPLDVVVELSPDSTEASSAPEMRKAFEKDVAPVSELISRCGGEVTDTAWLNRTLRAKVPAASVPRIEDLGVVAALDVPHRITRE